MFTYLDTRGPCSNMLHIVYEQLVRPDAEYISVELLITALQYHIVLSLGRALLLKC